jgi:ATP-binding cassette subfamily F protein 1
MKALSTGEEPFENCLPDGMDVLLVQQEVQADDTSALDTVVKADVELIALRRELAELEASENDATVSDEKRDLNDDRLKEVYERLEEIGSDSAEQRAASILKGLQFSDEELHKPTKHFSGGWRMRISLAQALFKQPRLLLLDEPTNHLDLHAVIWLESYLQTWKNTLVCVSHDRDFLTTVCTDIYQIWQHQLNHYRGNYSDFEEQFADKVAKYEKDFEKQEKRIKQLKAEGKVKGNVHKDKGREANSKKNKKELDLAAGKKKKKGGDSDSDGFGGTTKDKPALMEKLTHLNMSIRFTPASELPMPLIGVDSVSFRYPAKEGAPPNKLLIDKLDCGLNMDDRIAIVGANGTGKSTLLKLLMGQLQPTTGEISINRKLRLGVYTQHSSDTLDLSLTPVEYIVKVAEEAKIEGIRMQEARNLLGRFGLPGDLAVRQMSTLSGGEKARVVFVQLGICRAHILLLDEPTNHLDLETIDCLIEGIQDFEGGVCVVSHNMQLIGATCNQIWVVGESAQVTVFDGDIEDYRHHVEAELERLEALATAEAKKRTEIKKEERRVKQEAKDKAKEKKLADKAKELKISE